MNNSNPYNTNLFLEYLPIINARIKFYKQRFDSFSQKTNNIDISKTLVEAMDSEPGKTISVVAAINNISLTKESENRTFTNWNKQEKSYSVNKSIAYWFSLSDGQGNEIVVYIPYELQESIGKKICNGEVIYCRLKKERATSTKYKYFLKSIIFPGDIKDPKTHPQGNKEKIVCISDLHIGSKYCMKKLLSKRIKDINQYSRDENVSAVTITGDLIEGITVLNQKELLENLEDNAKTNAEQYEQVGEILKEFDDSLNIILIPGNHDKFRVEGNESYIVPNTISSDNYGKILEPQPAFDEKIMNIMGNRSNFNFYPNPSNITIAGRRISLTHGSSFSSYINASVYGSHWYSTKEVCQATLQKLHHSPNFIGNPNYKDVKNYNSSDVYDYMIIPQTPDVLITGHLHFHEMGEYQGTKTLTASTFQAQTPFQVSKDIDPNPGIVTAIDLDSLELSII